MVDNSSEIVLLVTLRQVVLSLSILRDIQGHPCGTEKSTPLLPEEMDDFEDLSSSDDSDSDASFRSFSPLTSNDEYYSSSDSSMDSGGSGDEEEDSHVDDGDDFQSCGKDLSRTRRSQSRGMIIIA